MRREETISELARRLFAPPRKDSAIDHDALRAGAEPIDLAAGQRAAEDAAEWRRSDSRQAARAGDEVPS
jgi:hypothetical protein